jgi:uncharacterized protein (DUF1919 family)
MGDHCLHIPLWDNNNNISDSYNKNDFVVSSLSIDSWLHFVHLASWRDKRKKEKKQKRLINWLIEIKYYINQ